VLAQESEFETLDRSLVPQWLRHARLNKSVRNKAAYETYPGKSIAEFFQLRRLSGPKTSVATITRYRSWSIRLFISSSSPLIMARPWTPPTRGGLYPALCGNRMIFRRPSQISMSFPSKKFFGRGNSCCVAIAIEDS
jgi:hypothetical protein